MKPEILHRKLERYITGKSMPAETKANSNLVVLYITGQTINTGRKVIAGIRNSPGVAGTYRLPLVLP